MQGGLLYSAPPPRSTGLKVELEADAYILQGGLLSHTQSGSRVSQSPGSHKARHLPSWKTRSTLSP